MQASKKRRCRTPRCRRKPNDKSAYCSRCTRRVYREKHPEGYAFDNLRNRARQREHEFTLSIQEFRHFCRTTSILDTRGKFKGCMSIDRRCPLRGYHAWNIRPLEIGENALIKHSPYHKQVASGVAENPF